MSAGSQSLCQRATNHFPQFCKGTTQTFAGQGEPDPWAVSARRQVQQPDEPYTLLPDDECILLSPSISLTCCEFIRTIIVICCRVIAIAVHYIHQLRSWPHLLMCNFAGEKVCEAALGHKCGFSCQCFTCASGNKCDCSCRWLVVGGFAIFVLSSW